MSLTMTRGEREKFLADVHVGVLSVANGDGAPLTVPIWYAYEPGGDIVMITGADTVKANALRAVRRASLCVQSEEPPFYKYVSVEGSVTVDEIVDEDQHRAIAYRYFGQEIGDAYLALTAGQETVTVRIRPDRWRTVDYAKQYG